MKIIIQLSLEEAAKLLEVHPIIVNRLPERSEINFELLTEQGKPVGFIAEVKR